MADAKNVDTAPAGGPPRTQRKGLDQLMGDLAKTDFSIRHRRVPEVPEGGGHVSPEVLAMVPPRSRYVRRWRRHARRCLHCANVFRYYGLKLD
jgi:hypothetical protein